LREVQRMSKRTLLTVVADVKHRWNSTGLMLKRFMEIRPDISIVGNDASLTKAFTEMKLPSDESWEFYAQVDKILQPAITVTKALSGSKYPTLSLVMPLYIGLLRTWGGLYLEGNGLIITHPLAAKLLKDLLKSCNDLHFGKINSSAARLALMSDPRTFNLKMITTDQAIVDGLRKSFREEFKRIRRELKTDYLAAREGEGAVGQPNNPPPPVPKEPKPPNKIMALLGLSALPGAVEGVLTPGEVFDESLYDNDAELVRFFEDPGIPFAIESNDKTVYGDAMYWWRHNEHKYPTIAIIARENLACFGATVSQEGTFNVTGAIASKARATVGDEHLSDLVYFNRTYRGSASALADVPGLAGFVKKAAMFSPLPVDLINNNDEDPVEVEQRREAAAALDREGELEQRVAEAVAAAEAILDPA
jgi:hypothetical protein